MIYLALAAAVVLAAGAGVLLWLMVGAGLHIVGCLMSSRYRQRHSWTYNRRRRRR